MENGRGDRFRYDEEGQLVEAWYNATDPANSGAGNTRYDQFNYDALGNRKGSNYVANHGWMTFTRKDNGLNQYHTWGANPANYDDEIPGWGAPGFANGVLNVDGNVAAGYNALNQAIMINTFAMGSDWLFLGYDPLGRCVKRWTGSPDFSAPFPWVAPESNPATYFYYDGWNLIQEGPSSATASRNYVHGARVDEIVKQITPGNWWERYFHYDARGHCTLQTDTAGNIVEQYEYDAFGQPYFYDSWGTSLGYSPWGNRFLFTGREYLSDLKLYDYRNRMYQPELGRFMQPDPKEFGADSGPEGENKSAYRRPWSTPNDDERLPVRTDVNLYRYCHNDPINRVDPTGFVDLNVFPPKEQIAKNADKAELSPDKFTVGGHGAPDSMIDSNKNDLSVRKLGDLIKANPKYDPKKPVELDSCKTGRDMHDGTIPFAQQLANYLGSKVIAPTKDIFFDENGKVTHETDGYFRTFTPQKGN